MEVLIAILLDRVRGEPPSRWHPVVWLGRLIGTLDRLAPRGRAWVEMTYGAAMVGCAVGAPALLAWLVDRWTCRLPRLVRAIVLGLALKPAFAWRSLEEHAERVRVPLAAGDLPAARQALAMIVSRQTAALDAPRVAAAAIESVAENAADSIVAPLFWYSAGGLPAAWAYRAANTLDAMIGYHTERYEWLGKPAARLDDVLNWVPARITAVLLAAAGGLRSGPRAARCALAVARRDARLTASPNAGWPMAAMAGVLQVELEKIGHYTLGAGHRRPHAGDLAEAIVCVRLVAMVAGLGAAAWRAVRPAPPAVAVERRLLA